MLFEKLRNLDSTLKFSAKGDEEKVCRGNNNYYQSTMKKNRKVPHLMFILLNRLAKKNMYTLIWITFGSIMTRFLLNNIVDRQNMSARS